MYYVLDEHRHVKVTDDMHEMGVFFENMDARRVDQTQVGDYWVSTVFLGIDHNWLGGGKPLLFETMVFISERKSAKDWGELDMDRYSTWKEAEEGHKEMVKKWSKKKAINK